MSYERDIAVIDEAIEQISKPDGFVTDRYLTTSDGFDSNYFPQVPGPKVVATCAVGGIEQAVWKLTGKAPAVHQFAHQPASRRSLFGRVLTRVNRKATKLFPDAEDIESVTFLAGDDEDARQRVLQVFEAVRADYQAAQSA